MTPEALLSWLGDTEQGPQFVYYEGHLAVDREYASAHSQPSTPALDAASMAWQLAETGKVFLVQRRTGNSFEYVAIRPTPKAKPSKWSLLREMGK